MPGSSLHASKNLNPDTSQQHILGNIGINGGGEPVAGSRLGHVSANGITMEQYAVYRNSDVRQNSKVINGSSDIANDGKAEDFTGPSLEDGPTSVKRQRVEKFVVNGHHFSIERAEMKTVDLNCNHNTDSDLEADVIVNGDASDSHLSKQTVIHAFPSISHCIQWIIKGKQLGDDSTQGKPLEESLENILYDSNHGDLEDFDKSLPEVGDKHVNILVTGSLHLVGGALRVVEGENACS